MPISFFSQLATFKRSAPEKFEILISCDYPSIHMVHKILTMHLLLQIRIHSRCSCFIRVFSSYPYPRLSHHLGIPSTPFSSFYHTTLIFLSLLSPTHTHTWSKSSFFHQNSLHFRFPILSSFPVTQFLSLSLLSCPSTFLP